MEAIIELRDALCAKLVAMGKPAIARYVPITKRDVLADGKWLVAMSDEDHTQRRDVDLRDAVIDLVYQRSLPDPTAATPDPFDNTAFLDGCINEAGSVRALFRDSGVLSGVEIAGYVQYQIEKTPLYLPELLLNHLIFAAVIRLRFHDENS